MISTADELFKALFPDDIVTLGFSRSDIFEIENLPEELPRGGYYPMVDKTLGFILFVQSGGHKSIAMVLGKLHAKIENRDIKSENEAIDLFLQHGYYWTPVWSGHYPRVITSKNFQFDYCDEEIGGRYGLDFRDKDLPI